MTNDFFLLQNWEMWCELFRATWPKNGIKYNVANGDVHFSSLLLWNVVYFPITFLFCFDIWYVFVSFVICPSFRSFIIPFGSPTGAKERERKKSGNRRKEKKNDVKSLNNSLEFLIRKCRKIQIVNHSIYIVTDTHTIMRTKLWKYSYREKCRKWKINGKNTIAIDWRYSSNRQSNNRLIENKNVWN